MASTASTTSGRWNGRCPLERPEHPLGRWHSNSLDKNDTDNFSYTDKSKHADSNASNKKNTYKNNGNCEAAAIKSGLPPCVWEPEAVSRWLCSAFQGWQTQGFTGYEPKGLSTAQDKGCVKCFALHCATS